MRRAPPEALRPALGLLRRAETAVGLLPQVETAGRLLPRVGAAALSLHRRGVPAVGGEAGRPRLAAEVAVALPRQPVVQASLDRAAADTETSSQNSSGARHAVPLHFFSTLLELRLPHVQWLGC